MNKYMNTYLYIIWFGCHEITGAVDAGVPHPAAQPRNEARRPSRTLLGMDFGINGFRTWVLGFECWGMGLGVWVQGLCCWGGG